MKKRRNGFGKGITILSAFAIAGITSVGVAQAQTQKPNILVIWGDDIGIANISAYTMGVMGGE